MKLNLIFFVLSSLSLFGSLSASADIRAFARDWCRRNPEQCADTPENRASIAQARAWGNSGRSYNPWGIR
jgi:hypothetical protein